MCVCVCVCSTVYLVIWCNSIPTAVAITDIFSDYDTLTLIIYIYGPSQRQIDACTYVCTVCVCVYVRAGACTMNPTFWKHTRLIFTYTMRQWVRPCRMIIYTRHAPAGMAMTAPAAGDVCDGHHSAVSTVHMPVRGPLHTSLRRGLYGRVSV